MKHLPIVSGKDVVRALGRAGYSLIRQRGSHVRMRKKLSTITLNVTIPLHDEIDRTTLASILKAAELSDDEFMDFLK